MLRILWDDIFPSNCTITMTYFGYVGSSFTFGKDSMPIEYLVFSIIIVLQRWKTEGAFRNFTLSSKLISKQSSVARATYIECSPWSTFRVFTKKCIRLIFSRTYCISSMLVYSFLDCSALVMICFQAVFYFPVLADLRLSKMFFTDEAGQFDLTSSAKKLTRLYQAYALGCVNTFGALPSILKASQSASEGAYPSTHYVVYSFSSSISTFKVCLDEF